MNANELNALIVSQYPMLDDKQLQAKLDLHQVISKVQSPNHKYTAHNMKYFKDVVEIRREMRRNKMVIKVDECDDDNGSNELPQLKQSHSVQILSCNIKSSRSKSTLNKIPTKLNLLLHRRPSIPLFTHSSSDHKIEG